MAERAGFLTWLIRTPEQITMAYLFKQADRYYFRRRIPSDLTSHIGKSEIKISLGVGISHKDAKIKSIRLSGEYQEYFDQLRQGKTKPKISQNQPAVISTAPTISTLPTLLDFLPTFVNEKGNKWGGSSARHNINATNLFVKIAGNRSLSDYTRHDIVDYMATMERVHKYYGKSDKDKNRPITEILKIATNQQKMGLKTLMKHLRSIKSVFKTANQYHDTILNLDQLFGGLDFSKNVRQPDQRIPWQVADLNRLFSTPIWTGTSKIKQSLRYNKGNKIIKDAYWWLPLIAIFSGCRLEESCQLQSGDLKSEGDIHYLDISDDDGKQLKTKTSIRQVPLHPILIDLGILDLIDTKNPTRRIFPELVRSGVDKKYSYEYSGNFSTYRKKTGIYQNWQDYHSFRHTATTALYHATGGDMMVVASIVGHGSNKKSQTADYTHIDLATKSDAVNKLKYDGLDIRHLYK